MTSKAPSCLCFHEILFTFSLFFYSFQSFLTQPLPLPRFKFKASRLPFSLYTLIYSSSFHASSCRHVVRRSSHPFASSCSFQTEGFSLVIGVGFERSERRRWLDSWKLGDKKHVCFSKHSISIRPAPSICPARIGPRDMERTVWWRNSLLASYSYAASPCIPRFLRCRVVVLTTSRGW